MWCMPCVKSLKCISLLHAYVFKAEGNGWRYERFRVCALPHLCMYTVIQVRRKRKNMATWIPVLESFIVVQTTLSGEEVMLTLVSVSFFFLSLCVIGCVNISEMQYMKLFTGKHSTQVVAETWFTWRLEAPSQNTRVFVFKKAKTLLDRIQISCYISIWSHVTGHITCHERGLYFYPCECTLCFIITEMAVITNPGKPIQYQWGFFWFMKVWFVKADFEGLWLTAVQEQHVL